MKLKSNSELLKHLFILLLLPLASVIHAQDYYWVGGSGNWSDYANHWATSSGGTEFHTSAPLSTDDVYFDENSFTAEGQVVTLDTYGSCRTMDWRGVSDNPSFIANISEGFDLSLSGSAYFASEMTTALWKISMQNTDRQNHEFDPGKGDFNVDFMDWTISYGKYRLLDSLSVGSLILQESNSFGDIGSFDSNGHAIHIRDILRMSNLFGSLDLSNSNIYTKSINTSNTIAPGGVINLTGAEVHIIYSDGTTTLNHTDFALPLFPKINVYEEHTMSGNRRFGEIEIKAGTTLRLGDCQLDDLKISNPSFDQLTRITSTISGVQATISSISDQIELEFAELQDINAVGAVYNAYSSVSLGNVTGWNFIKYDTQIDFHGPGIHFDSQINEDFAFDVTSNYGQDIQFRISNPDVAVIHSSGDRYIIKGIGSTEITAFYEESDFFNAAEEIRLLHVLEQEGQIVTFDPIEDTWIGEGSVNLNASSDSGLPVEYHVLGPATLNGNNVVFSGSGDVQVTASQPGNPRYRAAEDVIVTFKVFKREQTITFSEIADISEDAGFLNLDASADSGLPVSYSVVGPVEVVNGVLEFTGSGMVQVTAIQLGDDFYLAAEDVKRAFQITPITVEKPLSLNGTEVLAKVYPNPVTEFLFFDPELKIESFSIHDLNGRVFYQGELANDRLDMSGYDSGIYLLTIKQKDGEKVTQRIKVN